MDRSLRGRVALYCTLVALGLAADLWTKHLMFSWPLLRGGETYWLAPGYAGFQLSLNQGALFGMGQGNQAFFAAMSLLAALAAPVWLFGFKAARDRALTATLGVIGGGVLGNLYDRLGLAVWPWREPLPGEPVHAVRDWILLQAGPQWVWPNFNIADSLLVVGALVLFLHAFRSEHATAFTDSAEHASGHATDDQSR